MSRRDVEFSSGGQRVAAWLYRPDTPPPHACVVLGHGFGATRELGLEPFAERFAAAGIAALAFDYRHFGGSDGEPRQLIEPSRQRADWHAAIAFARELDGVDRERVAIWGTSFGGGHVIRVAAEDSRLAAAVAQVPFADGATMPLFTGARQTLRLTLHALRDQLGRTPHRIALVGPPYSLATMTTPDSEPGYMSLVPPGADWENSTPARVVLRAPFFRPVRYASRVTCPLLICVAERDSLALPGRARRAAALAPRGELRTYPCAHFDPYAGAMFERFAADQTAFLQLHLGVERREDRVELGDHVA